MAKSLKNIMGAGMPPLVAQMINGTAADGIVAAGSTQGTATQLSADVNVVTTTPASAGVLLAMNPAPGDEVVVTNLGANSLSVYPATGGAIQSGATNAAFAVGAGKSCKFIARNGSLNWIALLGA